jgi:hypothetical protein
MKQTIPVIVVCFLLSVKTPCQIITPVKKANLGVEADLKANYFDSIPFPDDDDWFPGNTGTGLYLIDTTGAAGIMSQYLVDPDYRKRCFTRPMNYPIYSIVNGKFLYDAIYVRDHYKNDSTAFTSSNKNGQSPGLWTGGTTPVPDKSDLNDVMVHVRRDGPNLTDSLWFIAGLSLHGNNGNRYFDFELYQTEVYYNQGDNKFYNYGPDAGHTSWKFDAAGNVVSPGDVIFSAEFGSSSLTLLEARIWVDQSSLSLNPTAFNWGGQFDGDGAGAQFGYATILPKTNGDFYSGVQSAPDTWAGPFGFVNVSDVLSTNYDSRHYMEVAVNMSKIGLDPYTILGTTGCNLSFRRFFAKTRSSTSFTSDLKDFVGPYRIARPVPAVAIGDGEMFCGREPDSSVISIDNPIASSIYTWTTLNGHIVTSPATGPSIVVDTPGVYIVTQTLFSGCAPYATDTITLSRDTEGCLILATGDMSFTGTINQSTVLLNWSTSSKDITRFDIERSTDGQFFKKMGTVGATTADNKEPSYKWVDEVSGVNNKMLYYRIRSIKGSLAEYSKIVSLKNSNAFSEDFFMLPNPAVNYLQIISRQNNYSKTMVRIFNSLGNKVIEATLNTENEKINVERLAPGIYLVHISSADEQHKTIKKLLISK